MIYEVSFTSEAKKAIKKYEKSNTVLFKKFTKLYEELKQHPRTGTGHPEPLKGGQDITYSRRLTANERIIYNIYDSEVVVLILSVAGHYDDK
jgi:toxin YoeB